MYHMFESINMKVSFGISTLFFFTQTQDDIDHRKPYWEMVARDRIRFRKRISETEKILYPILLEKMRKYKKKYKKENE